MLIIKLDVRPRFFVLQQWMLIVVVLIVPGQDIKNVIVGTTVKPRLYGWFRVLSAPQRRRRLSIFSRSMTIHVT